MNEVKYSFAPIGNEYTQILILGSLPGDRSLAQQQYYAHPYNRFWKLMAMIIGREVPMDYPSKVTMLLDAKIGLWDVVHSANRPGSVDAAIKNVEPNTLDAWINEHQHLQKIIFNGATAAKLYKKYFPYYAGITYMPMPATSAANAQMKIEQLYATWSGIML